MRRAEWTLVGAREPGPAASRARGHPTTARPARGGEARPCLQPPRCVGTVVAGTAPHREVARAAPCAGRLGGPLIVALESFAKDGDKIALERFRAASSRL
jgi:hypothetical protein